MKKSVMVLGAGALVIFAAGGVLQAQKAGSSEAGAHRKVTYISASSTEFKPGPTKGVSMTVLRGDPSKGAYEELTKFDPATMLACTRTPMMCGSSGLRAPTCIKTTKEKSA